MKKRSYKITSGLREGYSRNGVHHTMSEATSAVVGWMRERVEARIPVVSGLITEGLLIFPLKAWIEGEDPILKAQTFIFTGELSQPEDETRTDEEVENTLESLARNLKLTLGQDEVYIIYNKKNWAV